MTFVDSLDSILMLYSYSGFPEFSWAIFERGPSTNACTTEDNILPAPSPDDLLIQEIARADGESPTNRSKASIASKSMSDTEVKITDDDIARNLRVKRNTMSGLSIILTFMSILVAFRSVTRWFSGWRIAGLKITFVP